MKPVTSGNHAIGGARRQKKQVLKEEGDTQCQRQTINLPIGHPADEGGQRGSQKRPDENGEREPRRPRPAHPIAEDIKDVSARENELPV